MNAVASTEDERAGGVRARRGYSPEWILLSSGFRGAVARAVRLAGFVAIGAVLAALLLRHGADPWRYRNDDNGAWFSAVARAHLAKGLRATMGQDFFLSRSTGELVPYLHHPPIVGLYLAAWFRVTGSDSPWVARAATAALHIGAYVLFVLLVRQLLPDRPWAQLWAAGVFAVSPLSAFFGKMPNHEVPGLLFFLLAAFACMGPVPERLRPPLAAAASALAAFSAWHASFAVAGLLGAVAWAVRGGAARRAAAWGVTSLAIANGLILLQLLAAGGWQFRSDQTGATAHWMSAWVRPPDAVLALRSTYGKACGFLGVVPVVLATVWTVWTLAGWVRTLRIGEPARVLLGLVWGSWLYSVLFAEAVRVHVYQQMFTLPFVALASALALDAVARSLGPGRRGACAAVAVLCVALTLGFSLARLRKLYDQPSDYTVKAVADLQIQYY